MTCSIDTWLMEKLGLNNLMDLPKALKKEQERRIKVTLQHAKGQSIFYSKLLQNSNIEDNTPFHEIPFTLAKDIQSAEPFLCVSQSEVARMVTLQSSGTTAAPKRIAFSQEDLAATIDFFAAGMSQLIQSGQRMLVLWPGAMRPYGVSALLSEALHTKGIQVFSGEAQTTTLSLTQELHKYNPHVLVAAPWQLHILAEIAERGLANKALQAILASAECLSAALEQRLQQCGLLVLDHYGITEAGYGGGVECLQKHGYHLRELDLFVEIIHPITLQPLPHGERGEIVITTLTRHVMPLIRYRTGDIASILPGPCSCGSPLTRLSKIEGRLQYTEQGYISKHYTKGIFYERTLTATL